jgi:hypothetical protein
MNEHYPQVRLYSTVDETRYLYIRESLALTFYMRRSHQEVVHEVMRALEIYRRSVKPTRLGWYADPYTGDWDEFDDKGQSYIQKELLKEPATHVWICELPDTTTGYEFLYQGRLLEAQHLGVTSAVSFILPTEFMEAHGPGRVRELALELAGELPFTSGHAGLCFNFPESVLGTTGAIRELSFRHPGLDIAGLHFGSLSIGTRVNGVHWLNFLGQPVLRELGGPEGLRARLHSPGTLVEDMKNGRALVTLGAWPEAGDLEKGETLPAYQELARVLEPWLYLGRGAWSGFSDEDMRRWERRFLDT